MNNVTVKECLKEFVKNNKKTISIAGVSASVAFLGTVAVKTIQMKLIKSKADWFDKGYKAGVNVAVDSMSDKLKNPSKDIEEIMDKNIRKHVLKEDLD